MMMTTIQNVECSKTNTPAQSFLYGSPPSDPLYGIPPPTPYMRAPSSPLNGNGPSCPLHRSPPLAPCMGGPLNGSPLRLLLWEFWPLIYCRSSPPTPSPPKSISCYTMETNTFVSLRELVHLGFERVFLSS